VAAIAAATIGLYLVVSWFLCAGLINVFLERPVGRSEVAERFGRGGAMGFLPYLRLALWMAAPYAAAAATFVVGLVLADFDPESAVTLPQLVVPVAAAALPAALLAAAARTVSDYARIDLSRHHGLPAWRALLRAARFVLT